MIRQLNHNEISVKTPYRDQRFIDGARPLGGRWSSITYEWNFLAEHREEVRKLLIDVFGCDEDPSDDGDVDQIDTDLRWDGQ